VGLGGLERPILQIAGGDKDEPGTLGNQAVHHLWHRHARLGGRVEVVDVGHGGAGDSGLRILAPDIVGLAPTLIIVWALQDDAEDKLPCGNATRHHWQVGRVGQGSRKLGRGPGRTRRPGIAALSSTSGRSRRQQREQDHDKAGSK
jgi:hypothetical protein